MGRLEFKTIGEISEVISGSTPKTSVLENWNGHINWITPTDLKDGHNWYIFEAERKITNIGFKDAGLKMLPRGTVLLTSRAPIGKVAINATEMCTNQGFKSIICNSEVLYNEYLYFYLLGKKDYLNSLGRGATFKEISKTIVEGIQIPLPPLEIQKKIAAVLDKAQELIDKRKEQLAKLDEFVQSVFLEMFGDPLRNEKAWVQKPLGDITSLITDGKHGDSTNEEHSGYYFISAKDIHDGIIDYSNARQITKIDFEETHRRTDLCPGDLVIVNTGATIGKMAIVSKDYRTRKTTFQKSVAVIKTEKDYLNSTYLKFLFSVRLKDLVKTSTGSAQQNLLLSQMRKIIIILPPIGLQNQFATIVEKTEEQKSLMQQSLTEMENNFNSVMQQAFKGELFS